MLTISRRSCGVLSLFLGVLMSKKQSSFLFNGALKVFGIISLCVLSASVGGAFPRVVGASSYSISYADLVSIMLTAVSVLVTVLAIFLAVAGVVGWSTIEQKVHGKTHEIMINGLEKGGKLERMIAEMVERKSAEIIYNGVEQVDEEVLTGKLAESQDNTQ